MSTPLLFRSALSLSAAVLLAACGGSQPPISAPGAMPQTGTGQTRAPGAPASSDALIYASGGCGGICVLSYPTGSLVASIQVSGGAGAPCSDNAGNVFVPSQSQVLEYRHGGTSPIATLFLPGYAASSCSVDTTTNNLAVTFLDPHVGTVAVFANKAGSPTVYAPPIDTSFCGYDNAGNLFASGVLSDVTALSELQKGQTTFTALTINGTLGGQPGQVQWDGSHLTYEGRGVDRQPATISQLTVSGSVASVLRTVHLNVKSNRTTLSWIYDHKVLVPYSTEGTRFNKIGTWSYPAGGRRRSLIQFKTKFWAFQGVTVTVAPSRGGIEHENFFPLRP